ncbi:MAG: hydrogenase formation protein HypD [candidate division WOR-3 bacterium]|nr:hydrogenase formation protein HypD [candidate division WOR-3 bacterium]
MDLSDKAQQYLQKIERLTKKTVTLMEVCGTHTNAISSSGIRHFIPSPIKLLSGPGCPVCVTDQKDIDWMIALARSHQAIIATFGDLLRVPGTESSLAQEKSKGADIRVVYSPLDALRFALNSNKPVVFLGVGFETTAPTIAATIIKAQQQNIKNFYVLPLFKLIPPALRVIAQHPKVNINGFILPGHVSTIIGRKPYEFLVKEFHLPCVITGFEPLDILEGVYFLLEQITKQKPEVTIQYKRSVKEFGNQKAQLIMNQVFDKTDANWRGIGTIPDSGLKFTREYDKFDARHYFDLKIPKPKLSSCRCGEILLGLIIPPQCPLFAKSCQPENPYGPCMVSSEGACAAYYKYER